MHRIKMKRDRRRKPQQLSLSARGSWGGYRGGAGRPRGRSGFYIPHLERPRLSRHQAVHVTLRVRKDVPWLRQQGPADIIRQVFSAERDSKGFRLVQYSIRPDHLHLVCEADSKQCLARGIQRLASRIARGLNRQAGRRGKVFVDRYHEHVVRAPREARHLLCYVLLNAQKDVSRRGGRFIRGIDPYSSGTSFDGWADPGPPRPASGPPTVAAARSWLLRTAWRRHGLIRSDEKAVQALGPAPGP